MKADLDLSLEEIIERHQFSQDQATPQQTSPALMSDDEHDARMERVVEGLNCSLDELIERRRQSQPTYISRAAAPRHTPYQPQARNSSPRFKRILVKPFPTDVTVEQARDFFQMIAGPVKEVYLGINMAEIVFREYDGYRAYVRLDGSHWKENGKTIRVIPVYGPRSIDEVARGGSTGGQATVASNTQRRLRRQAEAAGAAAMTEPQDNA